MRSPLPLDAAPPPAAITAVVATYGRPDALAITIDAIRRQTRADWRLLVIGDGAGDATARLMSDLVARDARIRYVVLPERFGEQAGPNSVGMALAETEFVALVNHDDVPLPDHFERALEHLTSTRAGLYVGAAAFATRVTTADDGRPRPLFWKRSPLGRSLGVAFHGLPWMFDPASTWVFRREVAQRVGPWRSALRIWRAPIGEWILRAWRAGVVATIDDMIGVLKIDCFKHRDDDVPSYLRACPELAWLRDWAACTPADAMRALVADDLARSTHRPLPASRSRASLGSRLLVNPLTAQLFHATGLDAFTLYSLLTGGARGALLARAHRTRLGTPLPPAPDLAAAIAAARHALAHDGRTR